MPCNSVILSSDKKVPIVIYLSCILKWNSRDCSQKPCWSSQRAAVVNAGGTAFMSPFPGHFASLPKESSCLSTHPESWVMSWMTGGWEQAGRRADNTLGGIEGLKFLQWELLLIPSRSPSSSLWACLSADSFKWATGNLRALHGSPTHTFTLWRVLSTCSWDS